MESEVIKVLMIEDNADSVQLICDELGAVCGDRLKFESADRLTKGLELLKKETYDVILLDLSLPDSQGSNTFTKTYLHSSGTPVIVLSGNEDEALAIKTIQAGAQDYLVKGELDVDVMVRNIYFAVERHKTLNELRSSLAAVGNNDLKKMQEGIEVLRKDKEFMLNYTNDFLKNFNEIYSELNPDSTFDDKTKSVVIDLYNGIFPFASDDKDVVDIKPILMDIKENGIDIRPVLQRSFLIMAKDYVNSLSPEESSITHIRFLTAFMEGTMWVLDEVNYGKSCDVSTKKVGVEEDIVAEEDTEMFKSIIEGFRTLEKEKREVKLINLYKGVLIRYGAHTVSIGDKEVILSIHKYQRLPLEEEGHTYIKSDIFPKLVKAKVNALYKSELKVVLTDLVYVDSSPEKRLYMRIQPKGPIKTIIHYEDKKIEGEVIDLSVASIAVKVKTPCIIKEKSDIIGVIELSDITIETKIKGKIIGIYKQKGFTKVVFDILPDPFGEPLIAQYISQRQVEVVKTMKLSSE